jgi:single-strand DNA-binding protein
VAHPPPEAEEGLEIPLSFSGNQEWRRMARSLNKVMLIGNVGSDPEIRMTPSGSKVAKVSLATNRTFQDRSGQQQERTEWHRLTFFARLADIVEQWVNKGDRLYVEGRIEYSQTQDDQGGTRYWTDIVVNEMVMLGATSGGTSEGGFRGGPPSGGGDSTAGADAGPSTSDADDDLPF